jgi:hypothetical protein
VSEYSEFFLDSSASVAELELLEISHTNFTQTFRLVRNNRHGVTVTHEDFTSQAYTYCPMRLSLSGPREDLDFGLSVQLGDQGDIVNPELDAVIAADGLAERPTIRYRTYRSDDLTAPLYGPVRLEAKRFSQNRDGCSFEASAPSLNSTGTGEKYSIARFPMLSGLL